ncbi:MAG: alpha/beta hydrolase [Parvibaculaceae bacterium]|nr:alpha/beta hydrolase [Parvibaculaceae bacterium]
MPIEKIGSLNLYWERAGKQGTPPLLVISGTGSDLRRKPNFFDSPLVQDFDVASYDQRGLGQSDKPDADYSMAQYADDAAAMLDHLGWENVNVMGVSFGGMVAQHLALRHPNKVKNLVLACTSPGGAGGASYPLHKVADMEPFARAEKMLPLYDTRQTPQWIEDNPDIYKMMLKFMTDDPYADEEGRKEGALKQLKARSTHDCWDNLATITCPVFLAAGKFDAVALPETQQAMLSRLPNATLSLYEGGHLFLLQDRQAYKDIINFFHENT